MFLLSRCSVYRKPIARYELQEGVRTIFLHPDNIQAQIIILLTSLFTCVYIFLSWWSLINLCSLEMLTALYLKTNGKLFYFPLHRLTLFKHREVSRTVNFAKLKKNIVWKFMDFLRFERFFSPTSCGLCRIAKAQSISYTSKMLQLVIMLQGQDT